VEDRALAFFDYAGDPDNTFSLQSLVCFIEVGVWCDLDLWTCGLVDVSIKNVPLDICSLSLRLCIGPAHEACLSTGTWRGHVPPRKKIFVHNSEKCWQILKILSLLWCDGYRSKAVKFGTVVPRGQDMALSTTSLAEINRTQYHSWFADYFFIDMRLLSKSRCWRCVGRDVVCW